jgi:hypothetical protein
LIVYFGWAENAKGQIEQLRIERGRVTGFEPNPHRKQEWTGSIFKSVREAAAVTREKNRIR